MWRMANCAIHGAADNALKGDDHCCAPLARPDPSRMQAHLDSFRAHKASRSAEAVSRALDALARAANDAGGNVFEQVIAAAEAGCTHGEIVATLREEMGFGEPLVQV